MINGVSKSGKGIGLKAADTEKAKYTQYIVARTLEKQEPKVVDFVIF